MNKIEKTRYLLNEYKKGITKKIQEATTGEKYAIVSTGYDAVEFIGIFTSVESIINYFKDRGIGFKGRDGGDFIPWDEVSNNMDLLTDKGRGGDVWDVVKFEDEEPTDDNYAIYPFTEDKVY